MSSMEKRCENMVDVVRLHMLNSSSGILPENVSQIVVLYPDLESQVKREMLSGQVCHAEMPALQHWRLELWQCPDYHISVLFIQSDIWKLEDAFYVQLLP